MTGITDIIGGTGRRLVLACAVLAVAGCQETENANQGGLPLHLVATTGMIADALREIAGDRAEVTGLMGPGVDPHTYRQTRSDIARMTRADAVFWHGLYLEAQLQEFLLQLGEIQPVFAVAEAIPIDQRLSHEQYRGRYDPHVWMAPRLWKQVVLAVRDGLIKLDSAGQDQYTANAARYLLQIDTLAEYADSVLATVPKGARVLVTAHDAFRYFGRSFDYEVLGIQGISTESEASLKRVEDIVAELVRRDIGAIFVESSVSDRNVRALVEGAAARGHHVIIGGELFSDAMGVPGTYEGTYIGMIDHNVTLITRALGGVAPERGLHGQLALSRGQ